MSETYILREILKAINDGNQLLRHILAVEQSSNGYLAKIEKNTNPPSPRTTSIGIDFSTPAKE